MLPIAQNENPKTATARPQELSSGTSQGGGRKMGNGNERDIAVGIGKAPGLQEIIRIDVVHPEGNEQSSTDDGTVVAAPRVRSQSTNPDAKSAAATPTKNASAIHQLDGSSLNTMRHPDHPMRRHSAVIARDDTIS